VDPSTDDLRLELAGRYDAYEAWLHGSAESLRGLAVCLRSGFSGSILLTAELIELPSARGQWTTTAAPTDLAALTIQTTVESSAPFDIQVAGDVLSIAGGSQSLLVLAGSLDNLTSETVLAGPVDRQMKFAYVPDDRWQSPASQELTVYLVAPDRLLHRPTSSRPVVPGDIGGP
jgi:hypothetical protein